MKIENAKIESYATYLTENHRPPSRGGNGNALHAHVLNIDGEKYSFLGLGFRQWVYKSDTVSFEYEIKGQYKNIIAESIVTRDRNGKEVVRGNRGFKRKLRTAETRMPVSRRELNRADRG